MTINTDPAFVKAAQTTGTIFDNANGTATQTIFTAGADGSRIGSIVVTSQESVDRDLILYMNDGTDTFLQQTFTIPADAGNDPTILPINLLDTMPGLSAGDNAFPLQANYLLQAALTATPTSDIHVTVRIGGSYSV